MDTKLNLEELIKNIYTDLNTLSNSLLNNETKANNLRKLYEKLYKNLLGYKADEKQYTLHDMINDYAKKENKFNSQYICHSLRKDLNEWSHDNSNSLSNQKLEEYFIKFRNIVEFLTGISYVETKVFNKNFELSNFNLNDKQKEAVLSLKKITLVNAGPGTGKTHLIVARVLNEIKNENCKKIFALSFTNKASEELGNKINDKIFSTNLVKFRKNIFTGTIHSFVLGVIQEYFKISNREFDYIIIDDLELKEIKEEFENNDEIINQYLKDNKILTFDTIIELFLNTIKSNQNFQNFISKYLNEVIIDEAQDLDKLQYEILFLLNQYVKDLKLFFVGDQRQNIYAFKGGSLKNISEFFEDEKDFAYIELEYSYRCPQNTLAFVNQFEFTDCKNIHLKNALNNNGNNLRVEEFNNMEDEGNWIAKVIKSKDIPLSDIAIIYSNTFYFKNILESLNAFGIAFKVMGGQYFLDRNIKLIRYILNLIYTNNKFALKKIQQLIIKTEFKGESLDEVLIPLSDINFEKKDDYKILCNILKFIKFNQDKNKSILEILTEIDTLIKKKVIPKFISIDKLNELIVVIENDLILDEYEKLKLSFSAMHPELGKFYLRSDEIVLSEYFEEGKNFVTVTTVHSAKGLEWDMVIIPGMSQDSFPRYFKTEEERKKELPNELKKFYVSCTRTKKELYFTRSKSNSWGYKKEKSIFLNNIKANNE